MTTRIASLAAALAACLLLAACGGADKKAFKTDYEKQVTALKAIGNDVAQTLTSAKGKSDKQLEAKFAELANRTKAVNVQLKAPTPPSDAEQPLHDLIASVDQVTNDLRRIQQAAGLHNANSARSATQKLVRDSQGLKSNRQKLDKIVAKY